MTPATLNLTAVADAHNRAMSFYDLALQVGELVSRAGYPAFSLTVLDEHGHPHTHVKAALDEAARQMVQHHRRSTSEQFDSRPQRR
jgi:hypothetical protein